MSASAVGLFTEKVVDEGSSCAESSKGENLGFDWRRSGGGSKTEEGLVDGRNCVMTKNGLLSLEL